MDEMKFKKQYVAPAITVTAFRLTDVIMTSPIEGYNNHIIDDGDWGDWDDDFGGFGS